MLKVMRTAAPWTVALSLLPAFLAPPAFALYSQPSATVAGGGGSSSSASYSLVGVAGQPGIQGVSASASFRADHGFLSSLGGWHILYPVISATPGILTFTLTGGGTGSQPVAVSNSGGGTLKWRVVKGTPSETYFSVSPSTGTGNASFTVTADATGLATNVYTDTLTLSATGVAATVKVQLTLNVLQAGLYRLSVTIVSDDPIKGGGSVNSNAGIACSNTGSATTGMSGNCWADVSPGTVVTLMQTPDSNSTWATWSPAGCGTNQSCQVTMSGNKAVTATFPYAHMAKVSSSGARYESLATALGNAAASDTIFARDVTFTENVTMSGKTITLRGGRDPWYQPLNARTTLDGTLFIRGGKLIVEKLDIK